MKTLKELYSDLNIILQLPIGGICQDIQSAMSKDERRRTADNIFQDKMRILIRGASEYYFTRNTKSPTYIRIAKEIIWLGLNTESFISNLLQSLNKSPYSLPKSEGYTEFHSNVAGYPLYSGWEDQTSLEFIQTSMIFTAFYLWEPTGNGYYLPEEAKESLRFRIFCESLKDSEHLILSNIMPTSPISIRIPKIFVALYLDQCLSVGDIEHDLDFFFLPEESAHSDLNGRIDLPIIRKSDSVKLLVAMIEYRDNSELYFRAISEMSNPAAALIALEKIAKSILIERELTLREKAIKRRKQFYLKRKKGSEFDPIPKYFFVF